MLRVESHVEFDQVPPKLQDVLQTGISGTCVIHGKPHPAEAQRFHSAEQNVVVLDVCVLRDFQYHPFRWHSAHHLEEFVAHNRTG